MRISCRHCGEPYEIDERSLPRFGASVRCPACGGLFELPSRSAQAARRFEPRAMVPGPAPLSPAAGIDSAEEAAGSILTGAAMPSVREDLAEPENGRGAADTGIPEAAAAPVEEAPAAAPGEIARSIVEGFVERHAALLDRALRDGELLSALGAEIADAWDEYRARAAESGPGGRHFQDALNRMLFSGRRVF